jgi:hypothetical protein
MNDKPDTGHEMLDAGYLMLKSNSAKLLQAP